MKKFFVFIVGLFIVGTVFAVGENIPTSKTYVDNAVAQKQNTISANNGVAQVLTNTGTPGSIGTKNIYDASGTYAEQTDALVTAGIFNTAVQNAIDSEFVCIERNAQGECLLLEIRNVVQSLPSGYTRLEYIESTGTQYIDTGIYFSANSRIDCEFMPSYDYNYAIFGASNGAAYNQGEIALFYNNIDTWHIIEPVYPDSNSSGTVLVQPSFQENTVYRVTYDKDYFIMGDVVSPSHWYPDYVGNRTVYLFATNRDANSWIGGNTRIYYITFWENNNKVRDFIPARRDSDGVLGMYDLVTNTFFTNSGTGEFIAGPVFSYLPQN